MLLHDMVNKNLWDWKSHFKIPLLLYEIPMLWYDILKIRFRLLCYGVCWYMLRLAVNIPCVNGFLQKLQHISLSQGHFILFWWLLFYKIFSEANVSLKLWMAFKIILLQKLNQNHFNYYLIRQSAPCKKSTQVRHHLYQLAQIV